MTIEDAKKAKEIADKIVAAEGIMKNLHGEHCSMGVYAHQCNDCYPVDADMRGALTTELKRKIADLTKELDTL